jgi:hypothetical protein
MYLISYAENSIEILFRQHLLSFHSESFVRGTKGSVLRSWAIIPMYRYVQRNFYFHAQKF